MARRRLHGETQKRRKKKQTQALKRQETVSRVQATQRPAAFQRSGELSPQDIVFLQTMRDMGVSRIPHPGEAPARMEKFQRVQFSSAEEDKGRFLNAMASLGVQPLDEPGKPRRRGKKSKPRVGAEAPPARAASEAGTAAPPARRALPEENAAARRTPGDPDNFATSAPPSRRPKGAKPPRHDWGAEPPPVTRFAEEEAGLMAELMRNAEFDPAAKFEGAPEPEHRARSRKEPPPEPDNPDGELDLHGKTQEEAIRMVQSFLLTSQRQKLRDVLIITGKGLNSGEQGPVLREAVFHWLDRNGARFARAFGEAPPRLGGAGAIWVTLR